MANKNLSRKLLSPQEVSDKLTQYKDWDSNGKNISRDFEFKDFVQAFAFLSKVAIIAEKMDHHAEIWNVYNKVSLKLSTHDTQPAGGGLTDFDFEFVQLLEQAY